MLNTMALKIARTICIKNPFRALWKKIQILVFLLLVLQLTGRANPSSISANKTSSLEADTDSGHTALSEQLLKSRNILYQNPGAAKLAAWKGLKEAELEDDEKMQAAFSNILGIIYDIQAKLDSAVNFYQQAFMLYKKTDDYAGMFKVLNNLGVIKYKQGQYADALKNYESSINLLKNNNCEGNIADVYINIGLVYKEIGEFNKSLLYFLKAQEKYKRENNNDGLIYSNINLGTVYFMIKEVSQESGIL